ncbi:MAG: 50S ribosomal protein L9 [Candidatus Muiribacteriota bacterium]
MKIILIKDHSKIGKTGDIKNVASGYASNFLIPNKIAIPATKSNLKQLDNIKKINQSKDEKEKQKALKTKEELEETTLEIKTKTGEKGKLYGAITNKNISDELKKQKKIKMDKKKIIVKEPIKKVGNYTVELKLYPKINANLSVEIVSGENQ